MGFSYTPHLPLTRLNQKAKRPSGARGGAGGRGPPATTIHPFKIITDNIIIIITTKRAKRPSGARGGFGGAAAPPTPTTHKNRFFLKNSNNAFSDHPPRGRRPSKRGGFGGAGAPPTSSSIITNIITRHSSGARGRRPSKQGRVRGGGSPPAQ